MNILLRCVLMYLGCILASSDNVITSLWLMCKIVQRVVEYKSYGLKSVSQTPQDIVQDVKKTRAYPICGSAICRLCIFVEMGSEPFAVIAVCGLI